MTLGNEEQSCPQVPQFLASAFRSTHNVPQTSGAVPAQLELHLGPDAPFAQIDVAPEHAVPQPPQLCASSKFASQPSSGRAEQCTNPLRHALGGT